MAVFGWFMTGKLCSCTIRSLWSDIRCIHWGAYNLAANHIWRYCMRFDKMLALVES